MDLRTSLREHLGPYGQEHLLRFWPELEESGRQRLAQEINQVDFALMDRLARELLAAQPATPPKPATVEPVEVARVPETDSEWSGRRRAIDLGEESLAAGRVAAVLVAGGQGTRLGFNGPKGTYPIGPVSGASLFQVHAEKLVALGRRHARPIPLYIMTSPENHAETVAFFDRNRRFGLDHVRFFTQGQLPAVDRRTGRVLLAAPDRLALSPDGHGGTLAALARTGPDGSPSCLAEMAANGIRTLFYFQVDNPLVQVCEPDYLGLHRLAESEFSFKVVEKMRPDEKVGLVVLVDGHPRVIEYSDLSPELGEQRSPEGGLRLWAGSIAIHCLERSFVERLAEDGGRLPFHHAIKKVKCVDDAGRLTEPIEPNAVKFETFIFDALPLAQRFAVVETDRALEFEPLKNASGPDSPESVRRRMTDQFADWLERAGARVARADDGSVPFGLEISPLLAIDAAELRGKIEPGRLINGPTYLEP